MSLHYNRNIFIQKGLVGSKTYESCMWCALPMAFALGRCLGETKPSRERLYLKNW